MMIIKVMSLSLIIAFCKAAAPPLQPEDIDKHAVQSAGGGDAPEFAGAAAALNRKRQEAARAAKLKKCVEGPGALEQIAATGAAVFKDVRNFWKKKATPKERSTPKSAEGLRGSAEGLAQGTAELSRKRAEELLRDQDDCFQLAKNFKSVPPPTCASISNLKLGIFIPFCKACQDSSLPEAKFCEKTCATKCDDVERCDMQSVLPSSADTKKTRAAKTKAFCEGCGIRGKRNAIALHCPNMCASRAAAEWCGRQDKE
jgi:hypothetical protein